MKPDEEYPNSIRMRFVKLKDSVNVEESSKLDKLRNQQFDFLQNIKIHALYEMVNDSGVSIAEMMAVAHHSSVSASKQYQCIDSVSEANRPCTLGLVQNAP